MKIILSDIPGYFPTGYSEQSYIDARSERDGQEVLIVKTERKHQARNDESYRQRKVQAVVFDKYKLEVTTTESVSIEEFSISDDLQIQLESGEIHEAEFIDIPEPIYLQNSSFRKYELSYIDLGSKRTVNYLVYDASINPTYYTKFNYNGNSIYSKLYPEFDMTDYEITENKDNYISMVSSESAFKTISCVFYINDSYIQELKNDVNFDNLSTISMQANRITYIPSEVPLIEVDDQELEGIKKVTITLKYTQTLNYPYE